jgi:transcriptional regulator with XRE-family HTH domain
MDIREIGRQLRAHRAASGRTVASVALDAGLSVPYVANLENGRGNPTISALSRLAAALNIQLTVSLEQADREPQGLPKPVEIPQSLVRLGRTERFRLIAEAMSQQLGTDPGEIASHMLSSLAMTETWLRSALTETDCWRLIDALTLISLSPAARSADVSSGS